MKNRRVPYTSHIEKCTKQYWEFARHDSRLMLSYYIGELTFKDNKKREMTKKFGNTKCFAGCDAPDSLEHVQSCDRYDTKFSDFYIDGTDKQFVKYLAALDIERWRKYQCPLVFRLDRKQTKARNGN